MAAMKIYSMYYFLTFVMLSKMLTIRCVSIYNYEFKVRTVYTIQPGPGKPVHSTNPLLRLTPSAQAELCRAAIEYAIKNDVLLKMHTTLNPELREFGIFYKPQVPPHTHTALRCPCVPTTVLFLPEVKGNILMISVHRNEFLDERYTFIEEPVDSVTPADTYLPAVTPLPKIIKSSTPPNDVLSDLESEYRWLLCAAAVDKIQHKVSVSLSDWLERAGLYNIVDRGYSKEVTALKCTLLSSYVHTIYHYSRKYIRGNTGKKQAPRQSS